MDPKFNQLPPVEDFEKAYILCQYAHEIGFRGSTGKDFYLWITGMLDLLGLSNTAGLPQFMPAPGSTLTATASRQWTFLFPNENGTAATYNKVTTGTIVVPGDSIAIAQFDGTDYNNVKLIEMPSKPLADAYGTSVNDAATQRLVTALRDKVLEVEESVPDVADGPGTSMEQAASQRFVTEVRGEIPDISGLATKVELTSELYNEEIFTSTDWLEDLYWDFGNKNIGDLAPLSPTVAPLNNYGILEPIFVPKGTKVEARTRGGSAGRGYAFTDISRVVKVLAISNVNTITNPWIYETLEDGYLYFSCQKTNAVDFLVNIKYSKISKLQGETEYNEQLIAIQSERIDTIEENTADLPSRVYDIESQLYISRVKTPTDLMVAYYGNFEGKVLGDVAPSSPSPFTGTPSPDQWNALPRERIYKGQFISVRTRGGMNAMGYVIANLDEIITVIAPSNVDTINNPWIYEVEEDGYLYVSCRKGEKDSFETILMYERLDEVDSRIQENASNTLNLTNRVTVLESNASLSDIARYRNNPFPINNATLKVLVIGNSYADDPTTYLPDFIDASGIDTSKLCIYKLVQSGASLQDWVNNYNSGNNFSISRHGGTMIMPVVTGTVAELLAQEWDIITVQQVSGMSINYSTFDPALAKLMGYIRKDCINQKVCFAWQLIWAYASDYSSAPYGVERYNRIVSAVKQMISEVGIDIIIPTGTAIQNARLVSEPAINGGRDLTRDGTHLQYGAGRYIAAATWFQTLIAPVFNVAMLGNSARRVLNSSELENDYSIAVDESNYAVCQRAAFLACMDMYHVNNPS